MCLTLSGSLAASPTTPTDRPEIVFLSDAQAPDLVVVEVRGLSREALASVAGLGPADSAWSRWLSVVAETPGASNQDLPQLLGRWRLEDSAIRFEPRFPIAPGLELVARWHGSSAPLTEGSPTPNLEARHRVPDLERPPATRVLAVYPSAPVVPANLLRFYLHFSAPMSARHVVPHVRLVDDAGGTIQTAFVEIPEGLWAPERRRLTLLVHPGRVKRGVGPNTALGPVLEAGHSYRLEVGVEALDADMLPLSEPFVHHFETTTEDSTRPAPQRWRLETPTAGSREPLVAHLEEAADHALLTRRPRVESAAGQRIEGQVEIADGERRWSFVPEAPWQAEDHLLVVPNDLEDPSGNRVDRSFEEAPGEALETAEVTTLRWRPRRP